MGSRRAQMATKTSLPIFERLSRNALQNVMSFFDYKGNDFMKMRSINKKSKHSYMQELQKRFTADRMLSTLKQGFLIQCKEGLKAFMQGSVRLPYTVPKRLMPADPVVHSIPLDDSTLSTLNLMLQDTREFPFSRLDLLEDLYHPDQFDEDAVPSAALVMNMVMLCKRFKRAFESKFTQRS